MKLPAKFKTGLCRPFRRKDRVWIAFARRAANTVAGDYYDAFFRPTPGRGSPDSKSSAPNQPLMLVVADVAGKSVPAALLMATLQASLHTLSALSPTLLDLVTRLNQYACAQNTGRQRFTTAFIAEWRRDTGLLTYVNAGHNWPVLRRASGVVERLAAGGLPLGIKPDASYESANTVLGPGDVLLIFTDGVVEAKTAKGKNSGNCAC